jgi:hypothetical protein
LLKDLAIGEYTRLGIGSVTFFKTKKRGAGESSETLAAHARSSQPSRLLVRQEAEQKQQCYQEVRSFKEAIINILPRDFQTILQALVTLACLYEFILTRDAIWLLTAYAMANGSFSLPIVKTLLPAHKGSSQKEIEAP